MSPLERRYRRLMWLLPAEHRGARGEELVTLLLDLDSDRTRPHPAEVLSLVALALRLRLRPFTVRGRIPATVALTSLLIAFGTMHAGGTLDGYTGAVLPADLPAFTAGWRQHLIIGGIPLACAVAWILGARRLALVLFGGLFAVGTVDELRMLALPHYRAGLDLVGLLVGYAVPITILTLLGLAAYRRWPTPRPRPVWLALVPLGILAWKGTGVWGRAGVFVPEAAYTTLAWMLAIGAAGAAVAVTRRRRWWVRVGAGAAGFGLGWFVPDEVVAAVVWSHFDGGAVPMAAVIAATAATVFGVARLVRRIRGGSSPNPATH